MTYLLFFCLILFFAYALALVVFNDTPTAVDLLFSQLPEINLGLILIVSITLGLFIGFIVAILTFKVFNRHLEIKRLRKENISLQSQLKNIQIDFEKLAFDKESLEELYYNYTDDTTHTTDD